MFPRLSTTLVRVKINVMFRVKVGVNVMHESATIMDASCITT